MTHKPVLLKETVDALAVKPGGVYVDGTLGRAGHAREILERAGEGARLVGIDRDEQALSESAELLGKAPRVTLVHGRHGDIARIDRHFPKSAFANPSLGLEYDFAAEVHSAVLGQDDDAPHLCAIPVDWIDSAGRDRVAIIQ